MKSVNSYELAQIQGGTNADTAQLVGEVTMSLLKYAFRYWVKYCEKREHRRRGGVLDRSHYDLIKETHGT